MSTLYFEDIEVGHTRDLGTTTFEREEMLAFARDYDPQPFHVDPEAAKESVYGGLIASGWLTAAKCARLLVDGYMTDTATVGGRGMDELRWHAPVRPGDEVAVEMEVVEKYHSESNPGIGYTRTEVVGTNGDGDRVISMVGIGIVERRESEPSA